MHSWSQLQVFSPKQNTIPFLHSLSFFWCLPVCEQLCSHQMGSCGSWYWELLLKLVDAFKFWLKHIEITRNFGWRPVFLYYHFVCWCYHCFHGYHWYLVPVGAEFMWMYHKYFTLQTFSNLSSVLCIHLLVFFLTFSITAPYLSFISFAISQITENFCL